MLPHLHLSKILRFITLYLEVLILIFYLLNREVMTSLVTDAVTKSGRGDAVMFGTLVAPNNSTQIMQLGGAYALQMHEPWFQAGIRV